MQRYLQDLTFLHYPGDPVAPSWAFCRGHISDSEVFDVLPSYRSSSSTPWCCCATMDRKLPIWFLSTCPSSAGLPYQCASYIDLPSILFEVLYSTSSSHPLSLPLIWSTCKSQLGISNCT